MIFPQKRFQPRIYSDVAMLNLLIVVTYAGSFIQTDPQYFIATRYFSNEWLSDTSILFRVVLQHKGILTLKSVDETDIDTIYIERYWVVQLSCGTVY